MGMAYFYKNELEKAISCFDNAIVNDSTYTLAYVDKLSALFRLNRYEEAINFALDAKKLFPDEVEIPYYLGDIYSAMYDGATAIKYYEEALKLEEDNVDLIAVLGWQYYYEQDYDKAKVYAAKASEIDNTSKAAIELDKALKEQEKPEAERIVNFIRENYLYIDKVVDFEQKAEEFKSTQKLTNEDISNFIKDLKVKEDMFTFVIRNEDYDEFMKFEDLGHITSKMITPNTLYVKIDSFTAKTDVEFRNIVDKLHNSHNSNLVIDLRDNGGGLGTSANNILDMLLPESTISYTVDRKGRVSDTYSDKNYMKFNKIIVLVNENSASSSELLALGLKKHLNNVTIVGKPTLGKGVGQVGYESKIGKYCIFLVNFYWNVKEQNIAGGKIYPDVVVKGHSNDDYLDKIYKVINEN
jgi:hypothetical protein